MKDLYARREARHGLSALTELIPNPSAVGLLTERFARTRQVLPLDFNGVGALVLASQRVVSNRLMTPVLYAASLGRDVAVYGDPLSISTAEIHGQDAIRELWPELHGQWLDPAVTTDLARSELGFQHLLGAAELRSTLEAQKREGCPVGERRVGEPGDEPRRYGNPDDEGKRQTWPAKGERRHPSTSAIAAAAAAHAASSRS